MTKDPVCGMEIEDDKEKLKSEYEGRIYEFCSPDCRSMFEGKPDAYSHDTIQP